jgi:hypothetical protein
VNDFDEAFEIIGGFLGAVTLLMILLTWLEATLDSGLSRRQRPTCRFSPARMPATAPPRQACGVGLAAGQTGQAQSRARSAPRVSAIRLS